MSSKKKQIPPAGEIRQSQIISSFGPGSMVDLPDQSIIIGGLNHWIFGRERTRIFEPRLETYLQQKLGKPSIALYEPPVASQELLGPRTGIRNFMFPLWFVAQVDETFEGPNGKRYRTRPLLPWKKLAPLGGKYLDRNRKKRSVVPVRFVQACIYGHISDVDWRFYVHKGEEGCTGDLWLDEGGAGNDFADIFVRCEACKKRRPLSDATLPESKALGPCRGDRPWLGPNARQECVRDQKNQRVYNKLLVRSASSAYFSQTQTLIALPSNSEKIKQAVDEVYENYLQFAEDATDIQRERRKPQIESALEGFDNQAVWEEVQRRKSPGKAEIKSIKQVEIETLLSQPEEIGEDLPHQDFYARNRSLDQIPTNLKKYLERIVLVHRLKEVRAQVSFTRFEAPLADVDGELQLDVAPADLGLETDWFPAIETKGEGIFIAFNSSEIDTWLQRDAVKKRGVALNRGFQQWLKRREIKPNAENINYQFPGLPYIMLHSLSHLLMTSISLECGYSVSAIRERVYAGRSGYGILIYTGSSGAEGTLGGLIQVGRNIEYHLAKALEAGRLCSNDPVCAQHQPDETYEERFRHGAACHGCLLISETSCEQGNEFLDRTLVVETLEHRGAA
ncbi:MAG: DUF1998 domain-containing protein, partial [Acaryochloridaceae cyanobacterium RL_2_7]|nr:DUF1998 domain-containing protein [Acaryochloridaceae cyanobacterium RL_2_7]